MNKRTSLITNLTTKSVKITNYPDVLGAITGGTRLTLSSFHLATAAYPYANNAGKPIDALLLLQNNSVGEIDAILKLYIPDKDLNGQKNRFITPIAKPIRIGLRGGEVGLVNLPFTPTAATKAGNYLVQIEITVEQKTRNASPVRDTNGGSVLVLEELPEDRQTQYKELQTLSFSAQTQGKPTGTKAVINVPFEVLPAVISDLSQDVRPDYKSLWTVADYPDEDMLAERAGAVVTNLVPQLTRANVFIPLLKATQPYFERANYRLWAGEAVMIAKMLTLLLEMGIPVRNPNHPIPSPRWYVKLCRLAIQNPHNVAQIDRLVGEFLYHDLLYDATMFSFGVVETILNQRFGTIDEQTQQATALVSSIAGKHEPLNLRRTYFPLIMAGVISNARVSMPQEQIRDTLNLIATALEKRSGEIMDRETKQIYDMTNTQIEKALENF